ncbi:oxidoreductase [Calycina marina]|uniref:Oxidoreductase n=1 Tax=Calycina marina TaxID=1763456 RepID=A0A9P8CHN1_9HELO|nr:oxidoreductase [Calycina marina]
MGRLPAILCLHGGGANANIFHIQTIRIQRALADQFEFVFLDAPHETGPGPGVLPFFEGCTPYLRWTSETGQVSMPEKTRDLLVKTQEEQKKKDGRGFVGVMGFSQGGRVAAGLLLTHQLTKDTDAGEKGLRFGVFLNSVCPPMAYEVEGSDLTTKIEFPSLHVIGKKDPWKDSGRRLFEENFYEKQAVLLEFDVAHRLPTQQEDTAKLTAEILRMHRNTSAFDA